MSDKENVEKENEQFSSSILYVATAIYVGVCAMVFGALYAKLPTFGEAFLVLMKDYGTILAGIPVLVAVVVAKQQLDANRRQHVVNVKRTFRDELDALAGIDKLASLVSSTDFNRFSSNGRSPKGNFFRFRIQSVNLEHIDNIRDKNFSYLSKDVFQELKDLVHDYSVHSISDTEAKKQYDYLREQCSGLILASEMYYDQISKYWS
ncbi:hypothetical protein LQT97_14870 [Brucella pseudogrignonensis]|uniref:hypothetical protein n=1 Tax=Brucella pseudogrignonensis TaxID=419475 RepID=UPI001E653927|nr:hypothetical protein [Brucella pseudogrignonensis]MCD4512507.1 hypothetical protein [Brucella pseudogrignonensis]